MKSSLNVLFNYVLKIRISVWGLIYLPCIESQWASRSLRVPSTWWDTKHVFGLLDKGLHTHPKQTVHWQVVCAPHTRHLFLLRLFLVKEPFPALIYWFVGRHWADLWGGLKDAGTYFPLPICTNPFMDPDARLERAVAREVVTICVGKSSVCREEGCESNMRGWLVVLSLAVPL